MSMTPQEIVSELDNHIVGQPAAKRAVAIAQRIESGMVYVNTLTGAAPERPFGGTKNSGFGREQSEAGILEFVNAKNIVVAG